VTMQIPNCLAIKIAALEISSRFTLFDFLVALPQARLMLNG
jgi:hypothetical protein